MTVVLECALAVIRNSHARVEIKKMTRLRVWLDRRLRLDAPATRADLVRLDQAVENLETDCIARGHRLLVVATVGNVEKILTQI